MKKKVLAIVLTIVLAVSMTACGGTKKAETKEDTKQTETQVDKVDSEEQEVVETSEEVLNEYGVTDEEMQLYLDILKGKIKEYLESEGVSAIYWDDPILMSTLAVGLDCKDMYSTDEILDPCLKEDHNSMWGMYCKAAKEWKEEGNISEEKCKEFLDTTFLNWETFSDTYLTPAYNEVVGE